MTRSLLPGLALLTFVVPASAADALTWEGAPPTVYALEVQLPPKPPAQRLVFLPKLVVDATRFADDGRTPRAPIEGLSDLVWHHCLQLPAATLPKRKAAPLTRQELLTFSGNAKVDVQERQLLSRVGKGKAGLVTQLQLSTQAQSLPWTQATLEVERVFDPGARRLEACSFRLGWVQADGQQFAWSGTVAAGEPVDLDPARFAARVEASIGRGRDALKKLLSQARAGTGHTLGLTALACFALLRSGVSPAELEPNFQFMATQPFDHTYSVALYVMALEARSVTRAQLPPSGEVRSVTRFDRGEVGKRDLAEIQRATAWLLAARKQHEGWWSYSGHSDLGPTSHDGKTKALAGDRSNSQFAVLALHSAVASGVEVSPEVWLEILDEHQRAQEPSGDPGSLAGTEYARHSAFFTGDADDDAPRGGTKARPRGGDESRSLRRRGWGYGTRNPAGKGSAYGSMTSAGLSSLAVAREALAHAEKLPPELDQQARTNLQDGLAWLAHRFDPSRNPGRGEGWFFYYLYSVEKAMDLVGVEQLGRFNWWQQGAIELLSRQDATDGSWTKRLEDTAFALLFLNRATLPAKFEVEAVGRVMTGASQAWDAVVVPEVGRVRGGEVLRSLEGVSRGELKDRLELAKACLEHARPDVQGRLLADLAPLTEHRAKAIKRFAKKTARGLVKTEDPAELQALAGRFADLVRWEQERDYAGIPDLVAQLRAEAPPLLRAEQLRVAGALRAVEAIDVLLPRLEDRELDVRKASWQILRGLLGGGLEFDPDGPARLRSEQVSGLATWWEQNGPGARRAAQIQRAVEDLARPERAEAAAKALRGFGPDALRPLVDALRAEASRARAHALLKELSGKTLGPDPQAWLDALGE
ncbi:MAG: hypothetical protein KDD82_31000, partial [Planctomycetes bacterium]|nr:hypothetical protein [Planctomycetota bacterium]